MEPTNFDREPGRRLQIGGALAAGIGILLLIFLHAPPPGPAVDVRRIAWAFLAVGIFGIAAGTIGRKLWL
jgi:hypothetical protein